MSLHINPIMQVLSFVWPLLSDGIKAAAEVVALMLDSIYAMYDELLLESNPYTCTSSGTLPDFERFYKIVPGESDTDAVRRARLWAKIRSTGDLNISYFYSIAAALGYSVGSGEKHLTISDGDYPAFRAGISVSGDAVYDVAEGSSIYTVRVVGTDVETDFDLQNRFYQQHLFGIDFVYINE